jgi:hypothetical protein
MSGFTSQRNSPGASEGETLTRRRIFTGGALAVGRLATAAFGPPALGFALADVLRAAP